MTPRECLEDVCYWGKGCTGKPKCSYCEHWFDIAEAVAEAQREERLAIAAMIDAAVAQHRDGDSAASHILCSDFGCGNLVRLAAHIRGRGK